MPIYEYRCTACGHELEKIQRMSDEPLTVCPSCEESTLRRLISAAGFRLKGSGWYETDFKTGNKRNIIGSEGGDNPKSTGGDGDSGKDSKSSDSGKKEKSTTDSGTKPAGKDKSAA